MYANSPVTRRTFLQSSGIAVGSLLCAESQATAAQARPPVIDSHVHVWKNDSQYPFSPDVRNPPAEDALPSTLLDLMAKNGVDHTVIVHVIHYRWDCRYAGDAVKANPRKFQGVCRVNPTAETAAEDLAKWVRDYGFRGVRLSPAAGAAGDWINDRAPMDRIWQAATDLKIPMCILCPISRIPDVEQVIQRHPGLDVCIDHMADCPVDRPDELNKLLALAQHPRVFVKISHLWTLSRQAYPYRDTFDHVKRLHDRFGPHRLMWGTDWPLVEQHCSYDQAVALYRDEMDFLNADDRRWILGETALKLWPFAPG